MVSVSALAEPLAQMMRLVGSGLRFCKRLKYGWHNSFCNSQLAKNKVQVYKITPPGRLGGTYVFTRFSIEKQHFTRDKMCQIRNTYAISRLF